MRFYFDDDDALHRDRLARRTTSFVLVTSTVAALVAVVFAGVISQALLGTRDATLMAYGVLGLWAFTNLEIAYALLRVDERRRTYLIASVSNVVLTVVLTVTLVVGFDGGARGYVLGNYAASTVVLVGLWVFALRQRVGLDLRAPRTLGPMLRFGAPTVPADAAVFALNVVDRAWLLRADSPAAAGLYAVAVKLATLVIVAVRGFQAAWPPLAYSIVDEDEARNLYALVTTAYVVVTGPRGRRPHAARALGGEAADRRPLLRGPQGAAVGGAGLGAVRALPRLRHHRGAREGDHAHLPGRGGRAVGQRRRARVARRPAGPLGRRASPCARRTWRCSWPSTCSRGGCSRCPSTGRAWPASWRSSAPSRWPASWRCRRAGRTASRCARWRSRRSPLALAPEILRLRRELVEPRSTEG